MIVSVQVGGIPAPQGNHRRNPHGPGVYETSRGHGPWRRKVITALSKAYGGAEPTLGPVQVTATFYFPHLKGHYGTGRNETILKPTAPVFHTSSPDLDKLCRTIGDALQLAQVIRNDSQIAELQVIKAWGRPEEVGVHLSVRRLLE